MEFKATNIQFFDTSYKRQTSEDQYETVRQYSANIDINSEFCIQVSGDDKEAHKPSFAPFAVCCGISEEQQDAASEAYDIDEIMEALETAGFENNYHYLREHGQEM